MEENKAEKIKESLDMFDKGIELLAPLFDSQNSLMQFIKTFDEKINPIYEKFKEINDFFDKIELINKTTIRMKSYGNLNKKIKDDSFSNLFQ